MAFVLKVEGRRVFQDKLLVWGSLTQGTARTGDRVHLEVTGVERTATVRLIEKDARFVDEATAPGEACLSLALADAQELEQWRRKLPAVGGELRHVEQGVEVDAAAQVQADELAELEAQAQADALAESRLLEEVQMPGADVLYVPSEMPVSSY